MEINSLQRNNFNQNLVENHPFYSCIRPLVLFQKIGGGWIHRPLTFTNEKCQYYAFQMYCIFWELITICALIRIGFIFNKGISLNTENMLLIMQVSFYVTTSISQLASFIKYRQVLSFWDDLVNMLPERFNKQLGWSKVIIWVIIITAICSLTAVDVTAFYFVLKSNPETTYTKMATPWLGSVNEARVAVVATISCFLPSSITWFGAGQLFMVAAYYLRWGFKDLYGRMATDTQLVNQLATHKHGHMRLSQMTEDLDDILWGYTGASIIMSTFDMCFVIFTLRDSHSTLEIMGSVALITLALSTMIIIVVFSISINTWVSFYPLLHINDLVQEKHICIANALELCLSCTKPLIYSWEPLWSNIPW